MAIKAGQILHVANQFVVDRIQTGGAGQLNIPQEKVYELGNYRSVGIVRDVPDLTFSLECLDVDTEVEAILTGSTNPYADPAKTKYELALNKPIDIISPWKTPHGAFTSVHGVAVPNLYLESASYRYGLAENSGETFSLRGDSIYYVPGVPWQDLAAGSDVTAGALAFEHGPALAYTESGVTRYALSVSVEGPRLVRGTEYTDTAAGITLLGDYAAPPAGAKISVVYGAAASASYPQSGQTPFGGTGAGHLVHQDVSVKPAAIRGKDIDVFFSTALPGVDLGAGVGAPVEIRWPDVQSATLDWSVTLEEDREFGNPNAVGRDAADVPSVTGAIELKPRSVDAFFTRLRQISGVNDVAKIMGPGSSVAGALRIELRNPDSGGSTGSAIGAVLKTHYVPAVRFTMPGYTGTVQQKMSTTLNFESEDGVLETYKGTRV
jgi:hypothetical protein